MDGPYTDLELQDATRTMAFRGRQLASVSTRGATSLRWTEMRLFTVEPTEAHPTRYVLDIVGMSSVFHRPGAPVPCSKGVPTLPAQLPPDARPCLECFDKPAAPTGPVNFEEDRFNLQVCESPEEVIAALLRSGRSRGSDTMTGPATALLQQAARSDAAFRPDRNVTRL